MIETILIVPSKITTGCTKCGQHIDKGETVFQEGFNIRHYPECEMKEMN
jgi:hypothetical protein